MQYSGPVAHFLRDAGEGRNLGAPQDRNSHRRFSGELHHPHHHHQSHQSHQNHQNHHHHSSAALPFAGGSLRSAAGPGLLSEVWASVASWFLRPECGPVAVAPRAPPPCGPPPETARSPARSSPAREKRTQLQAPTICTSIRCTAPNCNCDCFTPGTRHLRYCETCKHGWVPHALDKLGTRHLFTASAPEPVQPNVVFDVASLVLYGCQALPIRLKILLDRLFSVLHKDQVVQVLHGFGWTQEDYARGYMLQEAHGGSLDRWSICSPEEEPLVLQQFLRFGETRALTQQLLLAQQALQEAPMLEHKKVMSPNRRPSPPGFPPMGFHPSRLAYMNGPAGSGKSSTGVSPLNRLQSMQPFDFRKLAAGLGGFPSLPDLTGARRGPASPPAGLNLTLPAPMPHLVPPPPAPVSGLSFPTASIANSAGSKSPSMGQDVAASDVESDDEADDENSCSVLNLSRDKTCRAQGPPPHQQHQHQHHQHHQQPSPQQAAKQQPHQQQPPQAQQRPSHLRKATTPTKRHWGSSNLPINLGTQFINPATGKKRVQCNVCLKTFCDKGALKIHFSAVHLREMHKCTVEGCNMMFSSRRSRNRHSANPNPKLHSPHLRRKISPHDGRSAQAHPLLIPPQAGLSLPTAAAAALNPLNPFGPFPLLTPPPDMRHHSALAAMDFKQSLNLSLRFEEAAGREAGRTGAIPLSEDGALALTTNNHHLHHHHHHRPSFAEEEDEDEDGILIDEEESQREEPDQPEDFSMSKRAKMSVSDVDDVISNMDSNEDSSSVIDSQSLKDELCLVINKRKRKSQNPTKCAAVPILTEDETSDVESEHNVSFEPKPPAPAPPKGETEEAPDEEEAPAERASGDEAPQAADAPQPMDLGKAGHDVNANEAEAGPQPQPEPEDKPQPMEDSDEEDDRPASNQSSASSQKSEESLDSANALRHLESLSHGHFGDAKGQSSAGPIGPPSPVRSHASCGGSSNGPDSPDDGSQFGHFDPNGQFISSMDVPIDKDNPRRCTACGKIFQNHFGVKTHYQNVHLKLMHKCNVDGCNAAFPSKRSRDRHSANLNLHRKLLSTCSSDKGSGSSASSLFAPLAPAEFLARLYADSQSVLNGERVAGLVLPPSLGFPVGGSFGGGVEDELPSPDADGKLPCRLCRVPQADAAQLRSHYEQHHSGELHRCLVAGCPRLFISSARRNLHADSEHLHHRPTGS